MERAILVGMDGSPGSAAALRWALEEGRRRDLPVEVALVWSFLDQHVPEVDHPFDPGYGEAQARDALAAYQTAAVGAGFDLRRHVVCDTPVRGLSQLSEQATMLVVGATGSGGFPGLRLGSTSDGVLTHASVPVVVVRGPAGDGPVVVGVDASAGSERVIRWAAEEAAIRDGRLLAVATWEQSLLTGWALSESSPYFEKVARRRADRLEEALAAVDTHGLTVERRVLEGSAAGSLLDIEDEVAASLLVIGSRGMAAATGALLGSVSRQLVHHATGPVLVVRP